MKRLTIIGLAAAITAALMVFIAAGTASATVLCQTDVLSGCGSASDVANGSTLTFSAEGSTTTTDIFGGLVGTCTGSTISGNTANTGSSTQTIAVKITSITFSGCNHPVTVNNATLGSLEIHNIAGTANGTVTGTDTTITIDETSLGTCNFLTSNTDLGTLTGTSSTGGAPTLDIKASIPSENCGFNATWEGSYKYTGVENFNVAAS